MNNFLYFAKINNKIKKIPGTKSTCNIFEYINFQELDESYNNFVVGDLVLVQKYKYKSGKTGFYHIFLIVDFNIISEKITYYGMLLSSKIEKVSYRANKIIKKNDKNKLRKDSIIKTDAIYEIFTQNILLKIGNIDKTNVEIYKSYLINNT